MEFCPKCGSLLLPTKKGRSFKLVCQRCKYTRKLKDRKDMKGYKISEDGKEVQEIAIVKAEKKKKVRPRETERENTEYYEEVYE